MKDILKDIVANKRVEISRLERLVSIDDLYAHAVQHVPVSFGNSIENTPCGIIAEFKRKSPSKGWIHKDADPIDVAVGYESCGAAAMSVLTDEKFFGGTLDDVVSVREKVSLPILRKDFVITEYQLHQASAAGADAVLLIAAVLSLSECQRLARVAHELKLETLLEVHKESELEYVNDDIDVVGVNNRNLGTFNTSVSVSERMAPVMPKSKTCISESGIRDANDVVSLLNLGYKGFLIGELLMRDANPSDALRKLLSDVSIMIKNGRI